MDPMQHIGRMENYFLLLMELYAHSIFASDNDVYIAGEYNDGNLTGSLLEKWDSAIFSLMVVMLHLQIQFGLLEMTFILQDMN